MGYFPYNVIVNEVVNINAYKAVFYKKAEGTEPAKLFLSSLDNKMRAKMTRTIDIFEARGTDLREPYSKHLDDGIFEFRAQLGNNISRVLYFFIVGNRAILTHGFIKKTNKTPPEEIQKAKLYRTDYLSRKGESNE